MPLPHYTQAKASIQKFETVQPNLFEVTMLPPAGIGFDTGLVLQHVIKISGLDAVNPAFEAVGQKYKFADRAGDVFRKITFKDAFPTGNPTFADELNYETQDPAAVSMSYRSDYWIEELV